jgi:hypothetical protein
VTAAGAPLLEVDVAAGLPSWLGRRFAHDAGATVTADTGVAPAPVDEDGIARVALTGAPEPTPGLALRGIAGADLLGVARGPDGRLPDPHLTLLCPGARLPGEAIAGRCENVIAPRPGREWLPADDDHDWLLDSTTLSAPVATLTEATASGAADTPATDPPAAPTGEPVAPGPADAGESSAPVAAGAEACRAVSPRRRSANGTIRLTRQALVIQQRIDAAALRRLNAANAWIDEGVTEADLCGGALGPDAFGG